MFTTLRLMKITKQRYSVRKPPQNLAENTIFKWYGNLQGVLSHDNQILLRNKDQGADLF